MKRVLMGIIPLLCMALLLASCDDENGTNGEMIAGTYSGSTLGLSENGSMMATTNRSVSVAALSDDEAKFLLINVVPDAEEVTIDATLSGSSSSISFSGSTTVNNAFTVSITGTYSTSFLNMTITRTALDGAYSGTYNMSFSDKGADMYFDVTTGNTAVDALVPTLKTLIESMVGQKISAMKISLKENGFMGLEWTTADGKTTSVPSELLLRYCIRDGILYWAFDKGVVDIANLLLKSTLQKYNLTMDKITSMLTDAEGDLGGYYAIPFHITSSDGKTGLYISKGLMVPLLTALSSLLSETIPDAYTTLFNSFMQLLPNAEKVDVGAYFTK